ncbi:hypothetical protein HAX54_019123 [Datura stramonium]|uniref:Uncharacterized protein n=1 Tax=Datura stramonium TaxID=4076 RepID=A0ABS8URC4_DATST|nr:hypothetical protein [Datura stramonium]
MHKAKKESKESAKAVNLEAKGARPCPIPDGLPKTREELEEEEKARMPDSPYTKLLRAKGTHPVCGLTNMVAFGCFLFSLYPSLFFSIIFLHYLDVEAASIARRQLLGDNGELPDTYEYAMTINMTFANARLKKAYVALQAWKKSIYSDPTNFTANWEGTMYNNFEGQVPSALFEKNLDAIFINNNRFHSTIPENLGNSNASVVVLANNKFYGCIPSSIGKMGNSLDELVFTNNELSAVCPRRLLLTSLKLFDTLAEISSLDPYLRICNPCRKSKSLTLHATSSWEMSQRTPVPCPIWPISHSLTTTSTAWIKHVLHHTPMIV